MSRAEFEPSTPEQWLAVAKERGIDAQAMLPTRTKSIGPFYIAGYAVECAIKAYLQRRGIERPKHGPEGHNLKGLWKAAGFRFSDIKDINGHRSYIIEKWTTNLRYTASLPTSLAKDNAALVAAAKGLVGWIQSQIKRTRRQK